MKWLKSRPYPRPGVINLIQVQNVQSPLAVAEGYEEERPSRHWMWGDKLYELRGDDFIYIPTKTLEEFIKDIGHDRPRTPG